MLSTLYLIYKHNIFFLNIYMHVFVFIYIHIINKHSAHTYIMSTKTFILDTINRD